MEGVEVANAIRGLETGLERILCAGAEEGVVLELLLGVVCELANSLLLGWCWHDGWRGGGDKR
jgi:hypothetical protein